jgi:hypothetical protein
MNEDVVHVVNRSGQERTPPNIKEAADFTPVTSKLVTTDVAIYGYVHPLIGNG